MDISAPKQERPIERIPGIERQWMAGALVYSLPGLMALFGWLLLGDFAWNARERAITPLAQLMLNSQGTSDTVIGLLIGSLPAAMGMFIAPIIGFRSDRFRSRFGRRIPFLFVSTPIASLAILGLASASSMGLWLHLILGEFSPGKFACFLSFFTFCWIGFEVAAIVSNTLFLALINDVVPKEVLGRFFGLFRIVSIAVGIFFNFFVMESAEEHLQSILTYLAIIYGIGFTVMCLRVRECPCPPVVLEEKREGFRASARRYFRECFSQRYYLWIFIAMAFANVAFAPVNLFSIFYAKSVGMSMDLYGKIIAGGFVCSLLVSYSIGSLADRFHPLRIAIASLLFYLPLCVWATIFARTPMTFAIGFIVHVFVSGLFFTGTASLGQRLFPQERFAQFASASQMALGLLTMLVPSVMGVILDLSEHNYRFTFFVGGALSALAVTAFLAVMKGFHRLGGDKGYQPEPVQV